MTAPIRDRRAEARDLYASYARRHPQKGARLLVKLEAQGEPTDERLAGMVEGLRAGLDGAVRCRRCGRALTDPESVKRKIGSDCLQKERAAA